MLLTKRSARPFRLALENHWTHVLTQGQELELLLTRIDRGKSKDTNGSTVIFTNSGPKKFCKSYKQNKLFLLFIVGRSLKGDCATVTMHTSEGGGQDKHRNTEWRTLGLLRTEGGTLYAELFMVCAPPCEYMWVSETKVPGKGLCM